MPPLAVNFVRPIIAVRRQGITVADAYLNDNRVVRFRVLARDPPTVRLPAGELPEHQAAIEAWLARQHAAAAEPV